MPAETRSQAKRVQLDEQHLQLGVNQRLTLHGHTEEGAGPIVDFHRTAEAGKSRYVVKSVIKKPAAAPSLRRLAASAVRRLHGLGGELSSREQAILKQDDDRIAADEARRLAMRAQKHAKMLTELCNPSPAIAALLEEKRVVGNLPPASEGRLFRLSYIRMLHKRNNKLVQQNVAV